MSASTRRYRQCARGLSARHDLYVDGADVAVAGCIARVSPIDSELRLGEFALANAGHVDAAMPCGAGGLAGLARAAGGRARCLRRVADIMEQRV